MKYLLVYDTNYNVINVFIVEDLNDVVISGLIDLIMNGYPEAPLKVLEETRRSVCIPYCPIRDRQGKTLQLDGSHLYALVKEFYYDV